MVVALSVLILSVVVGINSQESTEPDEQSRILLDLASAFTAADDDFTVPRQQSTYFPLTKSRSKNERINRLNYTEINSVEYRQKITGELRTWRGFEDLEATAMLSLIDLLFDSFSKLSTDVKTSLLQSKLSISDLQELPLGWQYLLPHQYFENVELNGAAYAGLVNAAPGNTALLYKIALVLRDESVVKKQEFMDNINLPDVFREDLGYILGYRWGIEDEDAATEDFQMATLLHIPTDVLMVINEATFEGLNLSYKLEDTSKWGLASPQAKVAWYTLFDKTVGWREIGGTPHHVIKHGHLMSGAPMDRLRELKDQQDIETSLLAEVLSNTNMDPVRVQEVWEALSKVDKEDSFTSQAMKLDVSQILSHYKQFPQSKLDHKVMLEDSWLAQSDLFSPWVNIIGFAFNYMKNDEFVSWSRQQLLDLGKFAAILSPAELDMVPASNYDDTVLSAIVSSAMSLSQLSTIYTKYNEQSGAVSVVHPNLFSALPSANLLSPITPFIWSQDKANLLTAAATFSPAQMHALQVITNPGYWSPANLSTILVINPDCMADITPSDLRFHLDHFVEGIYKAGPNKFHDIASSVQQLPRHLLMAWLEEVHGRPGSQKAGELWSSDVLLDRVLPTTIPDDAVNPYPSHALSNQYDRFTSANKSLLPSLALSGMSCHCINLVETPDTLEVLALYRYHSEQAGTISAMPSSSRKCWAKKVRQFLQLKSIVFNVTVTSEPELLSLLTTSDIKAIGGEVLITWGGPALVSITHPEVMHEVLMAVGHTHPHLFVRNGVTYNCMKVMANALLDFMIKEEGKVNLRVLTHVHNLIPYSDRRILQASKEDIRLFISTVLRPVCKAVCLKTKERDLVRDLILKAYGPSNKWTSLDLLELGDLMVLMARSDLAAVKPTALRRAAAHLSSTTLWTALLSDVRSYTKPVLYHEACGAWLGGKEGLQSQEANKVHDQWSMFGQFIVVGSFLQVEVLMNKSIVPKPRSSSGFRRKRQAYDGIDFKRVYSLVMNDMKTKFDAKELTDIQKTEATKVITETQKMLGDTSFAVLGLERGDKSQSEVLAVLAEYKDAGNMTIDQNTQVQKLAVDTQVRMIQELVGVLDLSATDLELTAEQLDIIMARHTFVLKPPGNVQPEVATEKEVEGTEAGVGNTGQDVEAIELLNTTTAENLSIEAKEAPDVTTVATPIEPDVDTESPLLETEVTTSTTSPPSVSTSVQPPVSSTSSSVSSTTASTPTTSVSTISTTMSTSTTVSTTAKLSTASNNDSTTESIKSSSSLESVLEEEDKFADILDQLATFKYYEPSSDFFSTIPNLDDVFLSCDVLIGAGSSASSISSTQLASMSSKEVANCLDTIGHLPWPQSVTESVWKVVKSKVTKLKVASMLPVKRQEMFLLQNLLSAIAATDSALLDMNRKNLDGISFLGSLLQSDDPVVLNLVQLYITLNDVTVTNPFTAVEAAALGQLLCGLRDEQWKDLITPAVFSSILTGHLSQLDCSVNNTTALHLTSMLTDLYGPTNTWTTSDMLSTGWVASNLSPEELSQLQHHAMEGFGGHAIKHLSREQLQSFSHHQLAMLSPHAASFISREQLMPHTNMHRRRGIRAAGGEDERLVATMEKIEPDMQVIDMEKTRIPKGLDADNGGVDSHGSRVGFETAAYILIMIFGHNVI